ncbi:DUF6213 family protein (plasmid) [Streptomyces sp. JL4002]|uniref:DUF6213 family protein n=1 Tax=Streptomyces sp. JL4002 TaxID=3404781 RepID=UPI003B27E56F
MRTVELLPAGGGKIYILATDFTCLLRELAHEWSQTELLDSRLNFDTMDAVAAELVIIADRIDVACMFET